MLCKDCEKEIKVLLNQEMICFDCYDKRMKARPFKLKPGIDRFWKKS